MPGSLGKLVEHQGSAPCIPVWKTGVYLSTPMLVGIPYPDDFGVRQKYALYAYRCEQWDELNRLLPTLGKIHYDVFGGKAAFYKMARLAKQHAGGMKSPSPALQ
jgi:hypothetical protein